MSDAHEGSPIVSLMSEGDLADLPVRCEEDGFAAPLPAIGSGEAGRYLALLEAYEQGQPETASAVLRHKGHVVLPWLADLVRDPRILAPVVRLFGPDLLCWTTNVFSKHAGDAKYVPWHQDATYWGLSSNDVVTAWVALTDSVPENGCMRVLPGSHKAELRPHNDTFAENSLLTRGQEMAVEVDENEAVDIVLKAGEMSLHHVLMAHASSPNQSDGRRVGIAIRYIPTRVRQTLDISDSATLVCGKDRYGHFQLEPCPTSADDPVAWAFHEQALEASRKILYHNSKR